MPVPTGLETLLRLMSPVTASDTTVDWDAMAASWGRRFPSDYRRFMEVYGSGSVQDILGISAPTTPEATDTGPNGGMRSDAEVAEELWRKVRKAPELEGAVPRLIPWAASCSGDFLCWDASDEDPDRWPILVYERGDSVWRRYDCGMVDFIARLLTADLPQNPLNDDSLWGRRSAIYLTHTEYLRRMRAGLIPLTGEPDPDAGVWPYWPSDAAE